MTDTKRNDNVPPNSRLFIVCGKSVEEEDFKDAFSTFGEVGEEKSLGTADDGGIVSGGERADPQGQEGREQGHRLCQVQQNLRSCSRRLGDEWEVSGSSS